MFDSLDVKIETVPRRVARAVLQLDETGGNVSLFHAQTGQLGPEERDRHPVQIPPRALILMASLLARARSRITCLDSALPADDAHST